jgi:hypothetical protein
VIGSEDAFSRIILRDRSCRDGRLRALQCLDNPPIVLEVRWLRRLSDIESRAPQVSAIYVDVLQADPNIELSSNDGVTDGEAPQHTGVTGLRVVVGQLANRTGRHN